MGLIAFALLGLGHVTIAMSSSYRGLLVSALLFGFGQATSTGLRTVWKDEVRALLRKNEHREAYRKAMLRILAGLGTATAILNSLVVGYIGEHFGMQAAALIFFCVAIAGLYWTARFKADWATGGLDEPLAPLSDVQELHRELTSVQITATYGRALPRSVTVQPDWVESSASSTSMSWLAKHSMSVAILN